MKTDGYDKTNIKMNNNVWVSDNVDRYFNEFCYNKMKTIKIVVLIFLCAITQNLQTE